MQVLERNFHTDLQRRGSGYYRTFRMRKVYLPPFSESSGDTNRRTDSFEGTDITDKSVNVDKMRQKIGMVFQQFNLFPHLTIKKISCWLRKSLD